MKGRADGWLLWPGYEEMEFHLLLDVLMKAGLRQMTPQLSSLNLPNDCLCPNFAGSSTKSPDTENIEISGMSNLTNYGEEFGKEQSDCHLLTQTPHSPSPVSRKAHVPHINVKVLTQEAFRKCCFFTWTGSNSVPLN